MADIKIIDQTVKGYYDNPAGRGNTAGSISILRDDLKKRYEKLKEKIELTIYHIGGENYLFHFLIPSENEERHNNYDVVLLIYNDGSKSRINIRDWYIKVFSNSPGFAFTYAHAYDLYEMVISDFKPKLPKKIFELPAVERNPHDLISYDKTIFFAVNHILESPSYINVNYIQTHSKSFIEKTFFMKIRDLDKIMGEIKKEDIRIKNEKKKEEDSKKNIVDKVKKGISKRIGKSIKPIQSIQQRKSSKKIKKR